MDRRNLLLILEAVFEQRRRWKHGSKIRPISRMLVNALNVARPAMGLRLARSMATAPPSDSQPRQSFLDRYRCAGADIVRRVGGGVKAHLRGFAAAHSETDEIGDEHVGARRRK